MQSLAIHCAIWDAKKLSQPLLNDFKFTKSINMTAFITNWGHSSAGRAPAWHAGGQRFESAWLHSNLINPTNYHSGDKKGSMDSCIPC